MSDRVGRVAYPDLDAGVSREVLAQLDEAATCSEHWKILITAGMGFFTDAYDLFIIGVAATMITAEWHIAGYQKSLLSSLALLTSAAGAIVFGRIADKLGRRRVYGYEVLILAAGAIASACSPGIWWRHCCVGRSWDAGDWSRDCPWHGVGLCWLPVPAGGDLGRGPLVPALWTFLP